MSATQDTMTAAVAAIEQGLQQIASAYADYTSAYQEAARAVYDATGQHRLADLEHAVGTSSVDQAVAMRLIALGLERILTHVPALGPVGPERLKSLK